MSHPLPPHPIMISLTPRPKYDIVSPYEEKITSRSKSSDRKDAILDMIIYGVKIDPTIDGIIDKHISESLISIITSIDTPTPRSLISYSDLDCDLCNKELYIDTMKKFYEHYRFDIIKIDLKKYIAFVNEIYLAYNNYIIFHSAKHSLDAVVMMHQLIDAIQIRERIFSNYEIFGLIIGMLAHDVGHFGLNNMYIAKYMPDMIEKFGASSTLEYFHLSKTNEIIEKTGLINDLPLSYQTQILSIVETLIIATDPLTTSSLIKEDIESSTVTHTKTRLDGTYTHHQNNKIKLIAKCADMAHFIRDAYVHQKWSQKITDEFHHQGDLELKTYGSITIPLCNRKGCNIVKSQIWFIQNYVLPLFKFANHVFNGTMFFHLARINENIKMWKDKEFEDFDGLDL
jgi:hypothetical protein